jgi:hypothetical protein
MRINQTLAGVTRASRHVSCGFRGFTSRKTLVPVWYFSAKRAALRALPLMYISGRDRIGPVVPKNSTSIRGTTSKQPGLMLIRSISNRTTVPWTRFHHFRLISRNSLKTPTSNTPGPKAKAAIRSKISFILRMELDCQRSNQNVPPVVESKCTTRTGKI